MKRLFITVMAALFALHAAYAAETITVKGSDTMVILAQRWAEIYMASHPGVVIQVTGGGSGTGISALINGTTDICIASRPMERPEMERLKAKYGSLGVEIKTAKDGLSIYVNQANQVKDLSIDQLKQIYTGRITNWKQAGGADAKIILYSRENNSGTYLYFKENVLGNEDFASNAQNMPGTAAVVNAISKDKNGIGYGGAAYAKGIRMMPVKKDASSKAYMPTEENVKTGAYPISRYLYMYTKTRPTGPIKQFIDWVLSKEGQAIVSKVGYFPVK